jgi:hypothetical protein
MNWNDLKKGAVVTVMLGGKLVEVFIAGSSHDRLQPDAQVCRASSYHQHLPEGESRPNPSQNQIYPGIVAASTTSSPATTYL